MDNYKNGVSKDFPHIWQSYLGFEQFSRNKGERLGDFLKQWKEKMSTAQSAGCEYSDILLACKLLDKSNLDCNEVKKIVAIVSNSSSGFFSEIVTRLEDLIVEDMHMQESSQMATFDISKFENDHLVEIKEEPLDKPLRVPDIQLSVLNHVTDDLIEECDEIRKLELSSCPNCSGELKSSTSICQFCDYELPVREISNDHLCSEMQESSLKTENDFKCFDTDLNKDDWNSDHSLMPASKSSNKVLQDNFPCNICGKIFHRSKRLTFHLKRHHVPKVLQEKEDNVENVKKKAWSKKVKNKDHPCDLCGKVFDRLPRLIAHLNRHHVQTEGIQCDRCGKKFRLPSWLEKHQVRCREEPAKKFVRKYKGNQSTTCDICGKSFRRPYGLRLHMAHHTKEKNFKCEYCPVAYGYESALNNHRKKHLENKSLECPKCSRFFSCEFDLKVHLRKSHPKEHRFRCGQCSYTTNSPNRFERHLLCHTTVQPYKCNLCNKIYKDKHGVKRHLWVYHKMERNENDKILECIGKNVEADD